MVLFNKLKQMLQPKPKEPQLTANIIKDKNPENVWSVVSKLGDGAFATVFKVENKADPKKLAALKLVEDIAALEESDLNLVLLEIEILSRCKHQYVLGLEEAYNYSGKLYMYLELCDGGGLDTVMSELQKGLTESQIRVVANQTCQALEYLHRQMVIHRDIKAANILLTSDGTTRLADFGVSALNNTYEQRRHTFTGTPYWTAPEVFECADFPQNDYSNKADIWSFGITLIELAEIEPPHHATRPERLYPKVVKGEPPKLDKSSGVTWHKDFHNILSLCLQKDPEKRPTASELLDHAFMNNQTDVKPLMVLLAEFKAEVFDEDDDNSSETGTGDEEGLNLSRLDSMDETEREPEKIVIDMSAGDSVIHPNLPISSPIESITEEFEQTVEPTAPGQKSPSDEAQSPSNELDLEMHSIAEPSDIVPQSPLRITDTEVDEASEESSKDEPEPVAPPTNFSDDPERTLPSSPAKSPGFEVNETTSPKEITSSSEDHEVSSPLGIVEVTPASASESSTEVPESPPVTPHKEAKTPKDSIRAKKNELAKDLDLAASSGDYVIRLKTDTDESKADREKRYKSVRRTRKFVVDGQLITSTQKRVVTIDGRSQAQEKLQNRKEAIRQLQKFQRREKLLYEKAGAESETKLSEFEQRARQCENLEIKKMNEEKERMSRNYKNGLTRLEQNHDRDFVSEKRKLKAENDMDLKKFKSRMKDTGKNAMKVEEARLEHAEASERKRELLRQFKLNLDKENMEKEQHYTQELETRFTKRMLETKQNQSEECLNLELHFLSEKHALIRKWNTIIDELKERSLQEKAQIVKQLNRDKFDLVRRLNLEKYESQNSDLEAVHEREMEELRNSQAQENKSLPKDLKKENRIRLEMHNQQILIMLKKNEITESEAKRRTVEFKKNDQKRKEDLLRKRANRQAKDLKALQEKQDNELQELISIQNEQKVRLDKAQSEKDSQFDKDFKQDLADLREKRKAKEKDHEAKFLQEVEQLKNNYKISPEDFTQQLQVNMQRENGEADWSPSNFQRHRFVNSTSMYLPTSTSNHDALSNASSGSQ